MRWRGGVPWRPAVWGASLLLCAWGLPAEGAGPAAPPLSSAGPVLEELARHLQDRSRPPQERLQIIRSFGDWGTSQVRDPLVAVLTDPLPALREAAARALGWPGNREAVPALRERVEAPGEAQPVRAAALRSIGRIGDESARSLLQAATRDADGAVRGAALWSLALGPLAKPADRTQYLVQLAEDGGLDLLLRAEAVQALGGVQETGVVDVLARLVEHGPRVPMPLPSASPSQQEVMGIRFRQIRDVRAWAAKALGDLGARAATPVLLRSAEDPDDFFLRLTSLEALRSWGVPEAKPVFVRRLDDPLPEIRQSALAGLATAQDRAVVDLVLARLSDRVATVRAQAALTLGELGDPRARPDLEALREKERDSQVLEAVEAALARLTP